MSNWINMNDTSEPCPSNMKHVPVGEQCMPLKDATDEEIEACVDEVSESVTDQINSILYGMFKLLG